MDEKIVISGISGVFPGSDNISSFRDNLFNKVDLVTAVQKYRKNYEFLPERSGKITKMEKFDLGFFGITSLQSDHMDPMLRKALEKTIEAVMDAGYHPSDLEGTNTAVLGGYCWGENENCEFYENRIPSANSIMGNQRSILTKRISYYLKLRGTAVVTDTACSSSFYAFEHAYTMIRDGLCDKAIVCGTNLSRNPFVTVQFARLGVLSQDGTCRTFDNAASGYVRSDAIVIMLLEKAKDAKRIYAEVIHAKTNCDGYKEDGITYPSSQLQEVLLKEFYDECKVDPTALTFVEAHGTGTVVGDPEELRAIDAIFLNGRNRPLHIGSVKSNIGHSEAASALCSIIKVIIGMETGYIPPNIHYKTPRKGVVPLEKGRMIVVTEKLPLPDNRGLFGVSSFGFGGANAHALLFWNTKLKINNGEPNDGLPRLLCVSSRTAEGVHIILDDFEKCDAEYAYLIHQIFRKPIENHLYRGFGIYTKEKELKRSLVNVKMTKKELYLVFTDYDKEFLKFGSEFMALPMFTKTTESIHNILFKATGISLLDIMKNPMEENFTNQILTAVATQISFANTLKEINLVPSRILGVGSGEIVAAYANGYLTLEQTILTLFYITFEINNISNQNGQTGNTTNEKWTAMHQEKLVENLSKYFNDNIISTTNGWDLRNLLTRDAVPLIIGTGAKDTSEYKNALLTDPHAKDLIQDFLTTLGRLYEYGFDMQLDKLYPTIDLPLGRGTPMLSPLIKWNHTRDCKVQYYDDQEEKIGHQIERVSPKTAEWNFITGHVVDGRNLFPATGYLCLVWKTFAEMLGESASEMKIVFEDVRFLRATNLSNEEHLELSITVESLSHVFQVVEDGVVIVTGRVFEKLSEHTFSNLEKEELEDEDLILDQTDLYKELQLRGYYYSGLFRSIQRSSVDVSKAVIKWNENWIAFLDCLLQLALLQDDTRSMYLPIYIYQLMIDAPKYLNMATKKSMVHVEVNKTLGILKTEGIELRSVNASSVARKKTKNPVLEVYRFIANESRCNLKDSVRVLLQFVLENSDNMRFKVVEVCPDEMEQDQLLCPLVQEILEEMPLIQQELSVLANKPMSLSNITVQKKSIETVTDCFLLIVSNLLESTELSVALNVIKDIKGFIMSREKLSTDLSKFNNTPLDVLCSYKTNEEILVLLRPIKKSSKEPLTVDITNAIDFQWIPKLQDLLKKHDKIIIYAEGDDTSGILGLVNCLKREHYGDKLMTVFIMDEAPKFDPKLKFYKKQLAKNLFINVWKDGTWGTYRHLQLPPTQTVQKEHCYANVLTRGDLSTMIWIEGNLNADEHALPEKELIHIYYSALNFRDLMTASGKIPPEVVTKNRIEQECVQGIEFAGRDAKGRRVMAMCQAGSLSTLIQCDKYFAYPIPDDWTMEEAATVPVVYATVIRAFNTISQFGPGQSILIHSGTGGVGQAAINLSLYYGLTVFVTVGTQEKRDFIKQHYPKIKEEHIGNSRDTSFEWMIRKYTNGRGVNIVLNSLAEEKLLASVRCLAKGGKFIEIGKFDLVSNNELTLHLLEKEAHFIGLAADRFIVTANSSENKVFYDQFMGLIKQGAIKPLPRTIFSKEEVEKAFRYMGQGKHIGKVLIKIRAEEEQKQCSVPRSLFEGLPRFYCNPAYSYVILGGLGGFGLELADFLVVRGARKLVLTSRFGISNGYQQYRIRIWKSYGVDVLISTCDISTEGGCIELLRTANELGSVYGIFNLAVVLRDALFDNQSTDDFKAVFSPKVSSTKYLDRISRKLCPNLRYFVIFSSLSCGRGNAGQSNYGMANSIMERICEKRKKEGYPALAIQWGAIGDVGLLAKEQDGEDEKVILGTLQQRISNCLQVLDKFLTQKEIIVSSMLVAETKHSNKASNPMEAILNLMGITNINTVSMYSTFPELGMDSMTAMEIKQTLEREYEIFLTGQDIKTMTLSKLKSLYDTQEIRAVVKGNERDTPLNIQLLFPYIGSEENANIPVLKLNTLVKDGESAPHIFALPGLEGTATVLEPLCKKLRAHVSCLQFSTENNAKTVSEMAVSLLPHIVSSNENLIILAYSFGCVLATELLHFLELNGRRVKVIYLDGSPDLLQNLLTQNLPIHDENALQMTLLTLLMAPYMPREHVVKHKNNFLRYKNIEEKIDYVISLLDEVKVSKCFKEICVSIYNRTLALYEYKPKTDKLKFPITLFKSTETILSGTSPDYNLSSLFENHIDVHSIKGTHVTMLENDDLASEINRICWSS